MQCSKQLWVADLAFRSTFAAFRLAEFEIFIVAACTTSRRGAVSANILQPLGMLAAKTCLVLVAGTLMIRQR